MRYAMNFLLIIFMLMTTDTETATRFTLKPLPYEYTALAPEISEETLHYHHDKHAAGYVAKLNALLPGTPYESLTLEEIIRRSDGAVYNNAAQVWNHEFYFGALSPEPQEHPRGALAEAINRSFGSFDKFREQMSAAAAALFGSGYVWLVERKPGQLEIFSGGNADNPMRHGLRPLLCIDLWEHAYYIDYRNARADAVNALWNCTDWKTVEQRYEKH